jgi:hypothetical protein
VTKSFLLATATLAMVILSAPFARADEYVNGYFRSDGTYVAPYYRSSPDSSYNNNWSVYPNVNPYTGEEGTKSPTWDDRSPNYNEQNYGDPGYDTGDE